MLYLLKISKFEVKENKKKTGSNLNIELKLTSPTETEDGKKLNVGYPVYDVVSLVKQDNYNPLERLAQLQEAAFGEKRKGFKTEELLGLDVMVRIKKESSEEFGDQNRIGRYLPKTASTESGAAGTSL